MTGRRLSRHGRAPLKAAAQKARAATQRSERAQTAVGALAEFGLAYGRVRAAVAKARKAGRGELAERQLHTLTTQLNQAAESLEHTRRR